MCYIILTNFFRKTNIYNILGYFAAFFFFFALAIFQYLAKNELISLTL